MSRPLFLKRMSSHRRGGLGWRTLRLLGWLVAGGFVLWAFGALRHDFPFAPGWISALFLIVLAVCLVRVRSARQKLLVIAGGVGLVMAW